MSRKLSERTELLFECVADGVNILSKELLKSTGVGAYGTLPIMKAIADHMVEHYMEGFETNSERAKFMEVCHVAREIVKEKFGVEAHNLDEEMLP